MILILIVGIGCFVGGLMAGASYGYQQGFYEASDWWFEQSRRQFRRSWDLINYYREMAGVKPGMDSKE